MLTKEKIKEMIQTVQEFNGMITLNYVPESTLYSTEELEGLYYSGQNKLEISKYYRTGFESKKINKDNFDEIVDDVYNKLNDNIGPHIIQALENLDLDQEGEYIKYFDREPELLKKFQEEVLKLKNG